MKTPLDIILERMRMYDPTEIIDLLNITSEELIDKFHEEIQNKEEFLMGEFEVFVITDDESQDENLDWDGFNED
jgi:hypothetical protein